VDGGLHYSYLISPGAEGYHYYWEDGAGTVPCSHRPSHDHPTDASAAFVFGPFGRGILLRTSEIQKKQRN